MVDKKKVASKFKQSLGLSKKALSKQWANTRDCFMFYSGDSMSYEDRIQYNTVDGGKKRAMVRFNKVMPYVDGVCGFMQQNRRVIKYVARINSSIKQQAYTRYMNAAADYVRQASGAPYLEGEQDLDMLVAGYGAVETDMSYVQGNATTCPNGEIIKARIDPERAFWDPTSRRKNISDARWVGYWNDYSLEDALSLFSGSDAEDFQPVTEQMDEENYIYNPYGGRYDKISFDDSVDWADKDEQRIRVYNFQWFEYESYWQADNPVKSFRNPESVQKALVEMQRIASEQENDDMFTFDPMADVLTFDSKIKTQLVELFGKFIKPVEFKRKAYYTAVISGSHVFTAFRSVSQHAFSIQFKTGTYDPIRKIWIGMVNNMMQPQLYYNKALTELMFTIASNSKGGVIIEKNSVEDIQEFEQKYASTTAAVVVEEGVISGNKIMPKGQSIPTTGLQDIITLSDASVADASGVDKAFLGGSAMQQESGILYRRRIRQVVSTIAKYFDSISLYQKVQARIDLDFMRIWGENNNGLEFEVQEEDGSYSTAVIASDKFMAEYGVTLTEAMETSEDKQEKAELISTIGDKLSAIDPAAAKIVYGISLKYLNLDGEDRQQISDALKGSQAPDPAYVQQLEEQIKLLSSETNMADVKRKVASAEKDLASIEEIKARTIKTLEEAQQKGVETDIMITNPSPTVNI